jgi:hypothetical protein
MSWKREPQNSPLAIIAINGLFAARCLAYNHSAEGLGIPRGLLEVFV